MFVMKLFTFKAPASLRCALRVRPICVWCFRTPGPVYLWQAPLNAADWNVKFFVMKLFMFKASASLTPCTDCCQSISHFSILGLVAGPLKRGRVRDNAVYVQSVRLLTTCMPSATHLCPVSIPWVPWQAPLNAAGWNVKFSVMKLLMLEYPSVSCFCTVGQSDLWACDRLP